MASRSSAAGCEHGTVCLDALPHVVETGFKRTLFDKRLAATTPAGRVTAQSKFATSKEAMGDGWTFPGPLVLPFDDLAEDPEYPAQSVRSWASYNKQLPITPERKTIYVVSPPDIAGGAAALMKNWDKPQVPRDAVLPSVPPHIPSPTVDDLCSYLRAFYYKMDVKKFEPKFRWQTWGGKGSTPLTGRIGLVTPAPDKELIGVRHRPAPDDLAKGQLNLNDVLDALIDRVPSDAYAIVMLVDHDLYEDDEDDFCCGRAYGADRIAVVSSFRYHPALDRDSKIDLEHMWPASHCQKYVDKLCSPTKRPSKRAKSSERPSLASSVTTPLGAAITAASKVLMPKTKDDFYGLWFSRTARTMVHEVAHCLGLDHCVYYACVMQGTGGLAEDVRQPPYLCPVCLSKVSRALYTSMGSSPAVSLQKRYIRERYEALREFCDDWKTVGMFVGLQAWIDKRLEQIAAESS